ncbi:MAG: hypothetical protein QOF37_108, partial [Thermoleophilaceae bacterium]|nr:hypothetical protein [Thermoleophilaceae bacterium]
MAGSALFPAALAAVGAAALRLASLAAPGGPVRLVAAAPLAVAVAVAEALGLGAVGLGGSQPALALAAALTYAAAWRWLPPPALPLTRELTGWVRAAPAAHRIAACALAGLWAGCAVWALRFPYLGLDG